MTQHQRNHTLGVPIRNLEKGGEGKANHLHNDTASLNRHYRTLIKMRQGCRQQWPWQPQDVIKHTTQSTDHFLS